MLVVLVATALAQPHLALHHEGKVYVETAPTSEEAAQLFAHAEYTDQHQDEYDSMYVFALSTTAIGELSVGQPLRSWVEDDRFVDCTVKRFIAEAPGPDRGELPNPVPEHMTSRATFLAELSCEADLGRGWLVAPTDPIPYRPSLTAVEGDAPAATQQIDIDPHWLATTAAFVASAEDVAVNRSRTVQRFDTPSGHHLLVTGELHTGAGEWWCGAEDLVLPYAGIVREGAEPELVDLQFFDAGDEVRAVMDLGRDGTLELQIVHGFGDTTSLRRGAVTVATGTRIWWSYCPC